jgi:hypothetical protein
MNKLKIYGALMAGAVMLLPAMTMAETLPQMQAAVIAKSSVSPSLVTKVQHGYCVDAYRLCRYRWGGGWRFRRCLAIRGCL